MPPHSAAHIVPPQYQYGLDRPILNPRGSIPSPSQHSLLLRSGHSAPIIDNLEDAASQNPQPNSPAGIPQVQPPASTSLTERPTKKRKRTTNDDDSASPQSIKVLLQKLDLSRGKRLALKGPNCWNLFLKTPEARAIFKEVGGVNDDSAMKKVSELWKKLTPEEKKAFAKHLDDGLTDEERALDEDESGELILPEEPFSSAPSGQVVGGVTSVRSEVSLKNDYHRVQKCVNEFIEKATSVAATHNAQFVVFAVSTHLGASSYQISQSTPGTNVFLNYAKDVDAEKHYAAQLQSYITSYSIAQITDLATKTQKKGGKKPSHDVKVTDRLREFIKAKTEGIVKTWPWTNTQSRLASSGYKLALAPLARTKIEWISQPSRSLHVDHITAIHLDLDDNLIDIV
ncbi:hypothetical protein PtA15_14A180 [Puccinia triticina]|uniref:HMG box domain-containing protein n=1 Tax=Puccinia triticina TaxID=208348 RepID=A0ABY7D154_9BASI|nr:uncharacterized protein PtA15_14A180 [Puccinia triticina]WAQ91298.1 hypothetical protein PtA15_14A180 [Puccinia triticina]